MSFLKPNGTYSLDNCDNQTGSFFSKTDLEKIFKCFNIKIKLNSDIIDEYSLNKYLSTHKILPHRSSFDEYLIAYLLINSKKPPSVVHQYKVGRYHCDLLVKYPNKSFIIEFLGPSHFCLTKYGIPKNPLERSKIIEDISGIEVINWPYWIHRCYKNLKCLFEKNSNGIAAIWNSKFLFSDFYFENSAEIILDINKNFNILNMGKSYTLNPDGFTKPEHPVLKSIRINREKLFKLIPKSLNQIDTSYWLPEELK